MTPELKAQWIAALESGRYTKTKKHLKDTRGFCCLGVLLAETGNKFSDQPEMWDEGIRRFPPLESDLNDGDELSCWGQELFGLPEHDHDKLIALNDESETFEPVVEYIKEHL